MRTQIGKWGNSLAIRIPAPFASEAKLERGLSVELSVSADQIVITPVRRQYRLEDLVAGITPENRQAETDWGEPVGNEAW